MLDAATLKRLAHRADGPGLLRALTHLGAIGSTGLLLWQALGSVWAVPLAVLHGYLVAFLFNPLHETAHRTAFRTRWLNDVLGHAAAFAILLPYHYYRAFHWDHHRHTQDPARDPELFRPLPRSRLGLAWYWSGVPVWRDRVRMLLVHGLLGRVDERWVAPERRATIAAEARAYLAGYAVVLAGSVVAGSWAVLWLWLLPLAVGQVMLRAYLLAEHTGCGHSRDMLENTRTMYTNAFVRWFAWDMPFHAAHHAYPAVPFHALARLNALLAARLRHTEPGYVAATRTVLRHLARERAAGPAPGARGT